MIKRRKALTSIITGFGTLISMPAWADGWSLKSLGKVHFLNTEDNSLLTAIVDTILPATDTPGAKDVGVPTLIEKLIQDCLPVDSQDIYRMGLIMTDAVSIGDYGKGFRELSTEEKLSVLKKMSDSTYPDQKNFMVMIKRMTIDGYMRSEYVMTNITNFEFAPNRYYGCVPV